jgi:hypothetical protein
MTMILLKVEDLPAGQEAAPADAGVVESWVDR